MDAALAADPELAYPMMIRDLMPAGLRGLMVATFLAAFMSTMDTHLCWGASYMVNDVYRRFMRPGRSERHYVAASRVAVVLLAGVAALVAWQMDSIQRGWIYIIEISAGIALVWLLRWYWWRVNAWAEIAAMAGSVVLANTRVLLGLIEPVVPAGVLQAVDAMYAPGMDLVRGVVILIVCTVLWVAVALATRPESDEGARRLLPAGPPRRLVGPRRAPHRSHLEGSVGGPHVARFPAGSALRLRQPAGRRLPSHREGHRGHASCRRLAGRGSARGAERACQRRRDAHGSRLVSRRPSGESDEISMIERIP